MSFETEDRIILQGPFVLMAFASTYIVLTFLVTLLLDADTVKQITSEDSYFESGGAVFWLLASLLFFILFVKRTVSNDLHFIKTKRNVFFFLLGCLFFVGFGEEISWGQRIIGFDTPELLTEINAQEEFNVHNLWIFHGKDAQGNRKSFIALLTNLDRLFSIFWFSYCLLIPIAYKLRSEIAGILNRIALPVPPIWIGSLFMLNYLISKVFEWVFYPVVEIKEHNFAFLFVVLGLWFARRYRGNLASVESEKHARA